MFHMPSFIFPLDKRFAAKTFFQLCFILAGITQPLLTYLCFILKSTSPVFNTESLQWHTQMSSCTCKWPNTFLFPSICPAHHTTTMHLAGELARASPSLNSTSPTCWTKAKQILTSQRLSNGILLLICCHGAALWKRGRKDKHQSPFPYLWWLLLFGGEGGL